MDSLNEQPNEQTVSQAAIDAMLAAANASTGDAPVAAEPEAPAPAEVEVDPAGEQLQPSPAMSEHFDADLARLHAVPVELAVEIGRTRMTIGDTLGLGPGSIITLNRMAGEPVDLLVNGRPIARGEVVVIDEEFGLRVTEVVGSAVPGAAG